MLASIKPWMYTRNPPSPEKCECSHVCEEELKKGVASVEARDWFTLNVIFTGFSTCITTCDDCLMESFNRDLVFKAKHCPDFGKFDAWVMGVARDLLATSVKYSTVPH